MHLLQLVLDQAARLVHLHDLAHGLFCITGAKGLHKLLYDLTVLLRYVALATLASKLVLKCHGSLLGLLELLSEFLVISLDRCQLLLMDFLELANLVVKVVGRGLSLVQGCLGIQVVIVGVALSYLLKFGLEVLASFLESLDFIAKFVASILSLLNETLGSFDFFLSLVGFISFHVVLNFVLA